MAYTVAQLNTLYQQANGLPNSTHTQTMAAIGMAESSGNPNARNPSGASGLWQIMPSHTSDAGWAFGSNFSDPATNARMAEFVFRRQGYAAWTAHTNGAYKQYLTAANIGGPAALMQSATGAVGNAVGGVVSGIFDVPGAIMEATRAALASFTNAAKTFGVASLGIMFILAGLALLMRRQVTEVAASAGKAAALA